MTRRRPAFLSAIVLGATLAAQPASELALEQRPFALYSAFWPNLHHLLWAEAWARRPSLGAPSAAGPMPEPLVAPLTPPEKAAWDAAVKYYDDELADLHPLFELGPIRKVMIAAGAELPAKGLTADHRRTLTAAAAVYRKYWWPSHDKANRTWLVDPMAKLATLGPGVPDRIARLYGSTWFKDRVRVGVVRVGAREGAYTAIDPAPAHITISSSAPNNTGWMAAEVLLHEASHALAMPLMQAFDAESKAQGKNTRDLWHVALFYMTGEVVRQSLNARGITYEPYLYKTGLFDRAWPQFKAPIEQHWRAYVDGRMTRDDAIKAIVAAVK